MSQGNESLSTQLSHRTHVLGLRLWELIALALAAVTLFILFLLSLRIRALGRSSKSKKQRLHPASTPIPDISKEIKEVQVNDITILCNAQTTVQAQTAPLYKLPAPAVVRVSSLGRQCSFSTVDISDDEKQVVTFTYGEEIELEMPNFHSVRRSKLASAEKFASNLSTTENGDNSVAQVSAELTERTPILVRETEDAGDSIGSCAYYTCAESQRYWSGCKGRRFSIEELERSTNGFAEGNILGKGGYGVVYHGLLPDGSVVAVKNLLNLSSNQATEFRVEVEAISCVRHKNLVGLLGYCAQGPDRLLVYEYVENGNLEQWLHGPLATSQPIPWNTRMDIVLGTAKGLAYLHEDLEPKVVHRDVKASNILLDSRWSAKLSDFGLAKVLGEGKSHVTTRVMGTFGYVAPEYASTGLLTESSDVYSFGVLMMEVITGRDPVDHSKPAREMNVVEWTKRMVESKRWEDVADPRLPEKPSSRALKRALLVALRCVDPDALRRPRMGHVVYMLEADDLTFSHVCNSKRNVR